MWYTFRIGVVTSKVTGVILIVDIVNTVTGVILIVDIVNTVTGVILIVDIVNTVTGVILTFTVIHTVTNAVHSHVIDATAVIAPTDVIYIVAPGTILYWKDAQHCDIILGLR